MYSDANKELENKKKDYKCSNRTTRFSATLSDRLAEKVLNKK